MHLGIPGIKKKLEWFQNVFQRLTVIFNFIFNKIKKNKYSTHVIITNNQFAALSTPSAMFEFTLVVFGPLPFKVIVFAAFANGNA